jgi:hypothetical protein
LASEKLGVPVEELDISDHTTKKADLERSAFDSCVGRDYSASVVSSPGSSVNPPA